MIRGMLVDDERLALVYLEQLLKELMDIEIIAALTDPVEAVQAAPELKPDVIFMDIDMPEMDGLTAAEIITDSCPDTNIVFVTAYNQFALEAFELHAMDYIVKPVQSRRLMKTVRRLEKKWSQLAEQTAMRENKAGCIRCFGMLQFEQEGHAAQPFRWRTTKTEELFCYLLHHRGSVVYKETLIDLFWPDTDPEKALAHLYTIIYHIRKTLKESHVDVQISRISGQVGYRLDLHQVALDVEEWENGIRNLGPVQPDHLEEHRRWVQEYSGDYFGDKGYAWAESERQRLRMMWLHHTVQVAERYTETGMLPAALSLYQRIVQLQPYSEEGHLGMMQVYDKMGERSAVEGQFRIVREMLEGELGIGLSETTLNWLEQWKLRG
ncbi:response regulator [Paenibacillus oceani]|uniref:Response regulator n=1 Tax=Paenibacillus oceani TaxID=2772510 RepID=A0A927GZK2_9BACL|nr:response regulator [Paenibacillus oceani]MBD2861559.1 response regulator [Paenibacillus oceani]